MWILINDYLTKPVEKILTVIAVLAVIYLTYVYLGSFWRERSLTGSESMNIVSQEIEVKSLIGKINESLNDYYKDYNRFPNSIEDLISEGYIRIDRKIKENWTFQLDDERPMKYITAISAELAEGFMMEIRYDRVNKHFRDRKTKEYNVPHLPRRW